MQNINKKILIVEDEPDSRMLYIDILTNSGYSADGAKDGDEALKMLESKEYALVLLDIIMPDKDGLETLSDIKKNSDKYGNPIVYMLTNISGENQIEKSIALGARGYILKADTTPSQLLETVKELYK